MKCIDTKLEGMTLRSWKFLDSLKAREYSSIEISENVGAALEWQGWKC